MANGIQNTWNVLAQTRNRAAMPMLAAAVRSRNAELHAGAIRASVHCKDPASHEFLIRHFGTLGEPEKAVLCDAHRAMPFRMSAALSAAVHDGDALACENACRIILLSCDYERVLILIRAAENRKHRHAVQVNAAMLQLVNQMHHDLSKEAVSDEPNRRDVFFLRRQAVRRLERAVQNFAHHQRLEIVESFLLLAPPDNSTLVRILRDAGHPCHRQVMSSLSASKAPAMIERLVAMLHDVAIPASALEIIARRTDRRFLDVLLHKLKQPVSLRVLQNMNRLRSVDWLETARETLVELDGRAQAVAVELAEASDLNHDSIFELLAMFMRRGSAEARRVSCQSLAAFYRPEANAIVREAITDSDSGVQAAAARQLRQRQLPDALPMLVTMLDSTSAEVRDAARSSLAEFNFVRYRAIFNLLDEKTLRTTGVLVRKVDPSSLFRLGEELTSPSSATRRRGIAMAVAMEATDDVREHLLILAEDEDVAVRLEAVAALSHCGGPEIVPALNMATQDPNGSVREAAVASLAHVRSGAPAATERIPAPDRRHR